MTAQLFTLPVLAHCAVTEDAIVSFVLSSTADGELLLGEIDGFAEPDFQALRQAA
jgi:hypothetical protein